MVVPTKSLTNELSSYGIARSTISGAPLDDEEARKTHAFWRACNYLALGMIYLQDNPLLREPLKPEHIKNRMLGHWGASPALSFIYTHLNRVIKQFDLDAIFMAGPGHGAPGVLGPVYLEGAYSEIYPDKSQDEEGLLRFFKQFSGSMKIQGPIFATQPTIDVAALILRDSLSLQKQDLRRA